MNWIYILLDVRYKWGLFKNRLCLKVLPWTGKPYDVQSTKEISKPMSKSEAERYLDLWTEGTEEDRELVAQWLSSVFDLPLITYKRDLKDFIYEFN